MPDRLSIMLDGMITAVDYGLSYDGIVSMPDAGLEDFGRRPGITGWFDDGVDAFRTTKATISRVVKKIRSKVIRFDRTASGRVNHRNSRASNWGNRISIADSKFGLDDGKPEAQPISPIIPSSQELPAETAQYTTAPQPRLRSSLQGSPRTTLRESIISTTGVSAASRASYINEGSSRQDGSVQIQHSSVGTQIVIPRTGFSTAPDHMGLQTDKQGETAPSPRGRDDSGDSQRLPRKKTASQYTITSQASHRDHSQHSCDNSGGSERLPRKKTNPQNSTASQVSRIGEESWQKIERVQIQHSPVTTPFPLQDTQLSVSLMSSQPRRLLESPSLVGQVSAALQARPDEDLSRGETAQTQHGLGDAESRKRDDSDVGHKSSKQGAG